MKKFKKQNALKKIRNETFQQNKNIETNSGEGENEFSPSFFHRKRREP